MRRWRRHDRSGPDVVIPTIEAPLIPPNAGLTRQQLDAFLVAMGGKPMWKRTTDELPEPGKLVEATDSGGYVHQLKYDSNLWWLPDGSMYVYFVPREWRYLKED